MSGLIFIAGQTREKQGKTDLLFHVLITILSTKANHPF
jgi:hypothetical protein